MKKTVHYRKDSIQIPLKVNNITLLQTLDHPSPLVTNWPKGEGHVMTSQIVSIGKNGEFETENTKYVPE